MNTPVVTIEGIPFYTNDAFIDSFEVVCCKKWLCPIVKRDLGKGLVPVWPDKYTWWSRLKAWMGFYRKVGAYGLYIPTRKQILIVALYSGKASLFGRFQFSPWTVTIVAHEYQHAGMQVSRQAGMIAKPFITEWYKRLLAQFGVTDSASLRYVETIFVPKMLVIDRMSEPSLQTVRSLWAPLCKKYKSLRPVWRFLTRKISDSEYMQTIWHPARTTYEQLFTRQSPYKKSLDMIAYYQELIFVSEIQAIKATVYPKDTTVLTIAKLAKLRDTL